MVKMIIDGICVSLLVWIEADLAVGRVFAANIPQVLESEHFFPLVNSLPLPEFSADKALWKPFRAVLGGASNGWMVRLGKNGII